MANFTAELTAKQDAIAALTERVAAFLADSGVDARAAHHMALVLDELLTNVAVHSGTIEAAVSVRLTISPERLTAEVVDDGAMFDPRVERSIDLSASVEERPVGGLGLLLVQQVTQDLAYERAEHRNRTTFSICRTPADRKGPGGGNGID
jgi:anti-sigma regulatory factor (Ser/Thr protein kinase)